MLKGFLKDSVAEINDQILSAGHSGLLAVGIDGLNATLYGYVKAIMSTVVMPLAYVILAIFLGLELYHIADHSFGDTSSGSSIPLKLIFKLMIRIIAAKALVDNTLVIMEAVYSMGQSIISGISSVLAGGTVSGAMDLPAINAAIDGMGLGEQLGTLPEMVIVNIAVFLVMGVVNVICAGRFVEIYIMVALAPVPLATLLSGELSDIGKNFFKNFAAVCLQGAIIYIVVSFFPFLLNSNILEVDPANLLSVLLYALVLGMTVFGAGRIAKSICHAM